MGTAKASPQNIQIIRDTLKREGFSDMAIAASMARFSVESKFDTNALNKGDGSDGSDSIGINQWNSDRAQGLRRYAAARGTKVHDPETQAMYYAAEAKGLVGGEGKYGAKLLAATTPDAAAQAVMGMVRPAGYTDANPTGGLGYKETLADTKRFASGDFTIKGYSGKSLTGATAANNAYLPADDRGLMQGSKSAGRTAEEGDAPLTVPDLNAFGDSLSNPQKPIDESPGGKIGQAVMGLLGVAGKFQEDSAKKNKGGNMFGTKTLGSSSSVPQSPSAHSIMAMIQNMGR